MNLKFIENVRAGKMFRKWDLLLLILVIVVALVIVVMILKPSGDTVEIYSSGKLIKTLPLSADAKFDVDGHLTVVVEESTVCVVDADCPDKICEIAGKISQTGMSIVCLPNKIVVTIKGGDFVDGVTQ